MLRPTERDKYKEKGISFESCGFKVKLGGFVVYSCLLTLDDEDTLSCLPLQPRFPRKRVWTPTEALSSLVDGSKKTTKRDVLTPITIVSNLIGSRDVTDKFP